MNVTTSNPSWSSQLAERFTRVQYSGSSHTWLITCWIGLQLRTSLLDHSKLRKKKHHKKLVTWYIKFSFKKTLKTDFYIIKWMKRKAANRCRSPLALHMTLHTHVENSSKHNHNHTFSLFSVSYSSMLHILITRHKNKQTFSLTVGFSTIIIVDI